MACSRAVYVAATKQHIGKTTSCVAITAGLKERYPKVGYIKPVGQQHVEVKLQTSLDRCDIVRVDKDARLFHTFFDMDCSLTDMSPLLVPAGYTKKYLDGKVSNDDQIVKVKEAFQRIYDTHDFTVVEGTGHVGVGSIIDMDNAQVAKLLGCDMVLVCNAGLGSAFDELALNRLVCQEAGVRVRGVILNRANPDKMDSTRYYFEKALKKWDIPLIGMVPWDNFLNAAAMMDFEKLFKTKLLSGDKYRLRHFRRIEMATVTLDKFKQKLNNPDYSNSLFVAHAMRLDLINGLLQHAAELEKQGKIWDGGLILAGKDPEGKDVESDHIKAALKEHALDSGIPLLHVPQTLAGAVAKISGYTAKLNSDDMKRTAAAVNHVKPYLDFDRLLG